MSQFQLVSRDMAAAGAEVRAAANKARTADAADAVSTLGAALPGSTTADLLPALAQQWDGAIDDWAASADAYADGLDAAAADAAAAEAMITGAWDGLRRWLGGR